jgi:TBC1 domain family protein 5
MYADRLSVLKADYSVCLQLLLKYPPPDQAHGPHTFVDDALYLRDHLNAQGGSKLIMKYTGKAAAAIRSPHGSRPTTPSFPGLNTLRQRGLGVRSPLHSPPTFINQQAGVEALLQGAAKGAKGMLERGEKLGINQALRDAVGEIRRNMQGFNESGHVPRPPKEILSQEGAVVALAAMERRNQQLASMLDDTVTSLKAISASNLDDKSKGLELIEIAAAKIQFVKIYLEDPTMEVPVVDRPVPEEHHVEADQDSSAGDTRKGAQVEPDVDEAKISSLSLNDDVPAIKTEQPISPPNPQAVDTSGQETTDDAPPAAASKPTRPPAVPTRSTLAQSSFAWMLESDDTSSSPSHSRVTPKSPPGSKTHKKRVSNNASREKNAFLFGEVTTETDGSDPLKMDDIFGMEPLRKKK